MPDPAFSLLMIDAVALVLLVVLVAPLDVLVVVEPATLVVIADIPFLEKATDYAKPLGLIACIGAGYR
jgi:hypothetical protein